MSEMIIHELQKTSCRKYAKGTLFLDEHVIIKIVTEYFKIDFRELITPCRRRNVSYVRHVLIYFLANNTKLAYKFIGEMFGGRDHSTAMNSVNVIKDLMTSDDEVFHQINTLKEKINHMDIKVSSEVNLVEVATRAIHLLNNLRNANKVYETNPGFEAKQSKRRWEQQVDSFLNCIDGQIYKHNSESVKIAINENSL